ncbi:MAG: VWA domain-containing protein, partial [Pirellulaceae bacterium]|nr:VWA domain-containing protein [Pirellulaceae bacterium]
SSPHAARTMILLTDGQPNVGPDPFTEAQACRAANITVHTISYSNFANTTLMQSIAQETGGDYYHAPNLWDLVTAFEQIGRDLPILLTQ